MPVFLRFQIRATAALALGIPLVSAGYWGATGQHLPLVVALLPRNAFVAAGFPLACGIGVLLLSYLLVAIIRTKKT